MAQSHVFRRHVRVVRETAARANVNAARPGIPQKPRRAPPPQAPARATAVAPPPVEAPVIPREIRTRFLLEVGTRAVLRTYWGDDCPNSYGRSQIGTHNAKVHLLDSNVVNDAKLGGEPTDYGEERWPKKCDHCESVPAPIGATAPCSCGCGQLREITTRQVFQSSLYRSPTGELVDYHDMAPGDMYLSTWRHDDNGKCTYWDNCTVPHLNVVLPDGFPWDTSSRASNCTMKDDRLHRCWVVHGDPNTEAVTVDKSGPTCAAGAGSILTPQYHGHLVKGILRKC